MLLQRRIFLALFFSAMLFGGLCYWLLLSEMSEAFELVEHRAVEANITRAQQSLTYESQKLTEIGYEWSAWDDTQQFMLGNNPEFETTTLVPDNFGPAGIDVVFLFDNDGQNRWSLIFDDAFKDARPLDQLGLDDSVTAVLLSSIEIDAYLEGWANTSFGRFVFAKQPILDNHDNGPVAGVLIFGRLVDDDAVLRIADHTQVDLQLLNYDEMMGLLRNNTTDTLYKNSPQERVDYATLTDIAGNPFAIAKVRTAKDTTQLSSQLLRRTLVSVSLLFCLITMIIWWLLRSLILSPLQRVISHVSHLSATGDMEKKLQYEGKGEIGMLASSFTQMQETIVDRDKKLSDNLKKLEYQATHDALTGLVNRRVFYQELEIIVQGSERKSSTHSIGMIDLDGFKAVNDSSGHPAGDAILVDVSSILTKAVYTTDVVARLGGDEFAILLFDCNEENARKRCESICRQIASKRFLWGAKAHKIGASIGLLEIPDSMDKVTDILQSADAACFTAKENGRNQVYVAPATIRDSSSPELQEQHWLKRLNTAMEEDHFLLFTQEIAPLQGISSGAEPAVNVLIRLRDFSSKRLLPPGAFIPAAQRYKLATRVDEWVVSQVLRCINVFDGIFAEKRRFWIKLDGASFANDAFIGFLTDSLKAEKLPPGRLNFELSECPRLQNVEQASQKINAIKRLGCDFSLDEFGSSFASLNLLKGLPIDHVKIDGSLIQNITNSQFDLMMVKSIVDVAKTLNIKTIACDVDTEALATTLTTLGVDFAQGNFIGRPEEILPNPSADKLAG